MSCESCDRSHVIKAYCYFSKNPTYAELVFEAPFSLTLFARHAIQNDLIWKTAASCKDLTREQSKILWSVVKPVLIKTLLEMKLQQG